MRRHHHANPGMMPAHGFDVVEHFCIEYDRLLSELQTKVTRLGMGGFSSTSRKAGYLQKINGRLGQIGDLLQRWLEQDKGHENLVRCMTENDFYRLARLHAILDQHYALAKAATSRVARENYTADPGVMHCRIFADEAKLAVEQRHKQDSGLDAAVKNSIGSLKSELKAGATQQAVSSGGSMFRAAGVAGPGSSSSKGHHGGGQELQPAGPGNFACPGDNDNWMSPAAVGGGPGADFVEEDDTGMTGGGMLGGGGLGPAALGGGLHNFSPDLRTGGGSNMDTLANLAAGPGVRAGASPRGGGGASVGVRASGAMAMQRNDGPVENRISNDALRDRGPSVEQPRVEKKSKSSPPVSPRGPPAGTTGARGMPAFPGDKPPVPVRKLSMLGGKKTFMTGGVMTESHIPMPNKQHNKVEKKKWGKNANDTPSSAGGFDGPVGYSKDSSGKWVKQASARNPNAKADFRAEGLESKAEDAGADTSYGGGGGYSPPEAPQSMGGGGAAAAEETPPAPAEETPAAPASAAEAPPPAEETPAAPASAAEAPPPAEETPPPAEETPAEETPAAPAEEEKPAEEDSAPPAEE